MTPADILRLRLENQRLARDSFRTAESVVEWFGAVQAQDYLGSLWALGLRMKTSTEARVEAAVEQRAIIRTWPMRGTLHFVTADDARWITRLCAPRVLAGISARLAREVDIDASVVARSREIVSRALEGARRLERAALYEALEARRIRTGKSRGLHILLWLAMEGTLCMAGRQGKQHTFALLDDWIPKSWLPDRDEALAALARRYFTSHGPATLHDFMWWAGITAKDALAGVDGAVRHLRSEQAGGRYYWMAAGCSAARQAVSKPEAAPCVRLLPAYDEFTVAYQDRSLLVGGGAMRMRTGFGLLNPVVVANGRVIGRWSRTLGKKSPSVKTTLLRTLRGAENQALRAAIERYEQFLVGGGPVTPRS